MIPQNLEGRDRKDCQDCQFPRELCISDLGRVLWTITMGIQGGSVLFGLLLVLAVFCHSGHSLQCYNCPNPTTDCKTAINCSSGFDTCLIARAGLQVYNQCWKFANCNFNDISTLLKESELRYIPEGAKRRKVTRTEDQATWKEVSLSLLRSCPPELGQPPP
uniref:CD59 glycoprotein n=1 Tax=Macaca fascicularis TaxID=9541 RepID=A0A2K5V4T9_MACFA